MLHKCEEPGVIGKMCTFKSWQKILKRQSQRRKKNTMRFDNKIETNVKIKQKLSKVIFIWCPPPTGRKQEVGKSNTHPERKVQITMFTSTGEKLGSITLCVRGGMRLGFGSGPGADTHEAVIYMRGACLVSGAQKELLACTRYQVHQQ